MNGLDLIKWIIDNDALYKQCVVQYRDGGGSYSGGEIASCPELAFFERDSEGHPYDVDITYEDKRTPNCFVI